MRCLQEIAYATLLPLQQIMRKSQEFKINWNSDLKSQGKETQLIEFLQFSSPCRTAIKQSLFDEELQGSSEEKHSDIIHDSFSQSAQSEVSLQANILDQHLSCLKSSIFKFWDKLLDFAFRDGRLAMFDIEEIENLQKFTEYLKQGKSLIPQCQLSLLLSALKKNSNLRTALEWIYDHIHPLLGDELILAAHRILLALAPVRQLCDSVEIIKAISAIPFNLINIFGEPSFKVLNYIQLFQIHPPCFQKNFHILSFYRSFVTTIILISQEYFHNPFYNLQAPHSIKEEKRRISLPKKKKPIHK